jgi:hypothetical protein
MNENEPLARMTEVVRIVGYNGPIFVTYLSPLAITIHNFGLLDIIVSFFSEPRKKTRLDISFVGYKRPWSLRTAADMIGSTVELYSLHSTVEPLITHIPRWTPKGMRYERLCVSEGYAKNRLENWSKKL